MKVGGLSTTDPGSNYDGISTRPDSNNSETQHAVEAVDFTRVWGPFEFAKKLQFGLQ